LPAAKDRFGFNQGTFAEPHANDAFAPETVIRAMPSDGKVCPKPDLWDEEEYPERGCR